jgi:hypothetical protein
MDEKMTETKKSYGNLLGSQQTQAVSHYYWFMASQNSIAEPKRLAIGLRFLISLWRTSVRHNFLPYDFFRFVSLPLQGNSYE